jgi:voltage-gated potassium channel
MKRKIYKLIEKGSQGSRINTLFDYFIITLISANVLAVIIESIRNLNPKVISVLWVFEIFSVSIFTIEYLLRIYVSDLTHPGPNKIRSALKFIFSFYGLVDLMTILPFYVPFIIKIDLRFIRIFRLVRFFRILKINRYNSSLTLIGSVIREKKSELTMTVFLSVLILIIAAFLMYIIEGSVQPEKFPNVLSTLWWAIATLTTIGYGDVYPITGLGKLLSGIIAVLGIGLVALPTGIISAGFIERINKSKSEKKITVCPHCGKEIEHT